MANKPVARVDAHLTKLREAGLDTQAFFAALVDIRDDTALSPKQREALYQIVAMESFIWYVEALNGSPVDREKAAEEARRVAEDHDDEPPFPREEVTVRQRPPKSRTKSVGKEQADPVQAPPKKGGPRPKSGVTKFERPPKKK